MALASAILSRQMQTSLVTAALKRDHVVFRRLMSSTTSHLKDIGKKALITTPIFYVNAKPHIGHAYSALLCDFAARWKKLNREDIFFSTGTDEHGSKVEKAAKTKGVPVEEFCKGVSSEFKSALDLIDVSYDDYIRTTETRHKRIVSALWNRLNKRGYIYRGNHTGWYCESDEEFLTEKQTEIKTIKSPRTIENDKADELYIEQRVSAQSGHPVELIEESNYMFRLSAFREILLKWLNENPDVIQPSVRVNEVKGWLEQGLEDLSISRPRERVKWAIPVPGDESQSIYVWLDALANYLTVSGIDLHTLEDTNDDALLDWPMATHIIGKDILRFHAVYWPAFLLAAGFKPPASIVAHAHWTVDRTKMSKSLGNVVCPKEITLKYGVSATRYFLLRNGGLVDDSDFSLELYISKYNEELANTLGNLVSRCISNKIMTNKEWPDSLTEHNIDPETERLIQKINNVTLQVSKHYNRFDVPRAIDSIMHLLRDVNAYFSGSEPWKLAASLRASTENSDITQQKLDRIILVSLHSARVSAILLQPIVPDVSSTLLDVMGVPLDERKLTNATWEMDKTYSYQVQIPNQETNISGKKKNVGLVVKLEQ